MRHELRHVRAFLKVAELASFTRAAAVLHVSQSALTVQVKQLEEELGVLLFDRNKRGVSITSSGRDLIGPLQRLVEDADAIVGFARDISSVRTGNISIAALPSIAAGMLPHVMHAFLAKYPEVRITMQDVVADRVRELVASRAVDLGLGTAARRDGEIDARPLYQDRLAAFVPAAHPLAQRDETTLRELSAWDLILPNHASSVRRLVEGTMGRERISFTVRHETNYMPTAIAMVRGGLGVAILPESAATEGLHGLVRLPIHKPHMNRQICLLRRADRTLSPAAARFVQVLQNFISQKAK